MSRSNEDVFFFVSKLFTLYQQRDLTKNMYRADHGNMTHMIPSTREINPQNETHIHRLNSNQTKSYRLKRSLNTSMKRSAQFIIFQGVTTFVINYYQIEHKDKKFDKNNQGNPTITFSQ